VATTLGVGTNRAAVLWVMPVFRGRLNASTSRIARPTAQYVYGAVSAEKASNVASIVFDACGRRTQSKPSKVFECIEVFYNRQRLHRGLDYQLPEQFEKMEAVTKFNFQKNRDRSSSVYFAMKHKT
jgi:hypothetical protein